MLWALQLSQIAWTAVHGRQAAKDIAYDGFVDLGVELIAQAGVAALDLRAVEFLQHV